ncbi:transcriptional regulator [Marinactinospora rubrisoli]|uniref:Transcriptional regulator n=1 Tax=Marinactinospora rubrisoli TaxID=2715399 RepID=A0ABW2KF15_9ACTN
MKHARSGADLRGVRVLASPPRPRLRSLYTGTALSAAEAARERGESRADGGHHLHRPPAAGLLDVVEEVPVHDEPIHRYRHDPGTGPGTAAPGGSAPEGHKLLVTALAEESRRRSAHRRPDPPGALTDAEVRIGPEEWRDVPERAHRTGADPHAAVRALRTLVTVPVNARPPLFGLWPGAAHGGTAGGAVGTSR